MGDRTYAEVYISRDDLDRANELLKCGDYPDHLLEETVDFAMIEDCEANYGEMDWVTDKLNSARIPYDHYWDGGCDYSAGILYVRFTSDGEMLTHTVYRYDEERAKFAETILSHLETKGLAVTQTLLKDAIAKGSNIFKADYPL